MSDTALGVKVFNRVEKLADLLNSIDASVIDTVYIADDGEMNKEKRRLFKRDYQFETVILDLEYDSGLGYGRNRIVEELDEEYLLIVDSDHVLPDNVPVLKRLLETRPNLGGVSGILIENDRIRAGAHDLHEENNLLVRDIQEKKKIQEIAGTPFIEFDFIPNAAMFRRECVEEYTWDKNYVIGMEHLDFYLGHKKQTDWLFGVCPAVLIRHYPGGSSSYIRNRRNKDKLRRSRQYFFEKWDYSEIVYLQGYWIDSYQVNSNIAGPLIKSALSRAPTTVKRLWANTLSRIRGLK